MKSNGKTLELFFVDGRPDGILSASVFGWTGHVLLVPRISLPHAIKREEMARTGVYMLLSDNGGPNSLYIGEAESVGTRLKQHDADKDWWDRAIVITSFDNALNKAHVRYLEARLVETTKSVNSKILTNGNTPARPSLTEAQIANMEGFLEQIQMVLPAIRVDALIDNRRGPIETPPGGTSEFSESSSVRGVEAVEARFRFTMPREGIEAFASVVNRGATDEFVVEAGSGARDQWRGAPPYTPNLKALHEELVASGILVSTGSICKFVQDYAFRSPSQAACVIAGTSSVHAMKDWVNTLTGQSLGDWQQDRLSIEVEAT